jgi:hypothetical protein
VYGTSSCRFTEPELFLIPKGYSGRIDIIYNQTNGQQRQYENKRRVYNIPNNGILLTQFNDNYGSIDQEYYYVDSLGNRQPLKIFTNSVGKNSERKSNDKDSMFAGIFNQGTMGVYGNMKFAYQEFIVSSYEKIDSFNSREYFIQFDKKLSSILKDDFGP